MENLFLMKNTFSKKMHFGTNFKFRIENYLNTGLGGVVKYYHLQNLFLRINYAKYVEHFIHRRPGNLNLDYFHSFSLKYKTDVHGIKLSTLSDRKKQVVFRRKIVKFNF